MQNRPATKRSKTIPRLLDGKYFEIITSLEDSNVTARCVTCGKLRKGTLLSTGNFMKHINSCHPSIAPAVEIYRKEGPTVSSNPSRQPTITSAFPKLTTNVVSLYFDFILRIMHELYSFLILNILFSF